MDHATKEKFAATTSQDLTTGNACLETPPAIFQKLNEDFGPFDVDLTADAANHLCPRWLGPGSEYPDALKVPWLAVGKKGYSNPPYGRFVPHILEKAKWEAAQGFDSTLLLPMRATEAFRDYVIQGATSLLFCDKRIVFWEGGAPRLNKDPKSARFGKPDPALFDSIIVRYAPGMRFHPPRVGIWKVPPHTGPMGWGT